MIIDKYDLQILATLQAQGRITSVELSEVVHLSASQCQRRMKKLEDAGIIKGYVALLDGHALGLEIEAIVSVTLSSQGGNPAEEFRQVIAQHPEILGLVRINTLFQHSEKYRDPCELPVIPSFPRIHPRIEWVEQ
jgi:DNA-binding Lrp family transcriptional regulator